MRDPRRVGAASGGWGRLPQFVAGPLLKSVTVEAFQGSRDVSIQFSRKINFLIGKNGSGKTQLINLINATLNGNLRVLLTARYDRIVVELEAFEKEPE